MINVAVLGYGTVGSADGIVQVEGMDRAVYGEIDRKSVV